MKLEINHRKKNGGKNDYTETKQHATEKKKQWVNDEIKEKYRKYLKTNDNEKHNLKNYLWDAAKAVLTGKFIVIQAFLK